MGASMKTKIKTTVNASPEVVVENVKLSKKNFHHAVWKIADFMGIDDFDELVAPIISDFCKIKGWDFNMEQYAEEFKSLELRSGAINQGMERG